MHREIFHTFGGVVEPNSAPTLKSVAVSLCRICRYCGNGEKWFPVGLHSMVVADLLPPHLKFHGLLHDEPECCTNDIPHDLKTKWQRMFEDTLLSRFYTSDGVKPPSLEEFKQIKKADYDAVHGEVWCGAGTKALRDRYDRIPAVEHITRRYMKEYSYADCLDSDGRAVKDFIRLFNLYKGLLKA